MAESLASARFARGDPDQRFEIFVALLRHGGRAVNDLTTAQMISSRMRWYIAVLAAILIDGLAWRQSKSHDR